jgi:hypothetical protein
MQAYHSERILVKEQSEAGQTHRLFEAGQFANVAPGLVPGGPFIV